MSRRTLISNRGELWAGGFNGFMWFIDSRRDVGLQDFRVKGYMTFMMIFMSGPVRFMGSGSFEKSATPNLRGSFCALSLSGLSSGMGEGLGFRGNPEMRT